MISSERNAAATLIFPIGRFLGAFHAESPPTWWRRGKGKVSLAYRSVQLGDLIATLGDEASGGGWRSAHRPVDEPLRPWTRTDVAETATRQWNVARPMIKIGKYLDQGLLAEVGEDPRSRVRFAQENRLIPLMTCLMTGVGGQIHGIGLPGGSVVVEVSRPTFDVYALAAAKGSLWTACEAVGQMRRAAGEDLDAAGVLECVLPELQTLISAHAVCLDDSRWAREAG